MGFFGGNYDKVGPGVSKNAPEKNRFFLFFELLGRKFSKLILLNIIYVITLIPLILGTILSVRVNPYILSDTNAVNSLPLFVFTGDIIGLILIIASVFITGPATCGMTYVVRNMQNQRHAWVFSDFIEHFAKNFKQGLIMSIVDILAVLLLYIAFCFYSFIVVSPLKYCIIVISLIFLMMHYYIYTMIVTFDMKLKDIFKNSAIFAIAKLPLNIFITIILLIIVVLSIWYLLAGFALAILITVSFMAFLITYCTYPTIEKTMLTHQSSDNEEPERDFEDAE